MSRTWRFSGAQQFREVLAEVNSLKDQVASLKDEVGKLRQQQAATQQLAEASLQLQSLTPPVTFIDVTVVEVDLDLDLTVSAIDAIDFDLLSGGLKNDMKKQPGGCSQRTPSVDMFGPDGIFEAGDLSDLLRRCGADGPTGWNNPLKA